MFNYILRRLCLLPLTLFCIILVNFIIVNLAPGDPVTITEISPDGSLTRKEGNSIAFGSDDRYLQFREQYGLTLPIILNFWPWTSKEEAYKILWQIVNKKEEPGNPTEMVFKDWDQLRVRFGDRARFIMPILLKIIEDKNTTPAIRQMAFHFFIRGGTRQAILGADLNEEERKYNQKIAVENNELKELALFASDSNEEQNKKIQNAREWYNANESYYHFNPDFSEKMAIVFTQSRFFRYISKVVTLDFGTLRNDSNKTVVSEVTKRFKYSLTLSLIPMLITFILCQILGCIMAMKQHRWEDITLNMICLLFYAVPVFVVAPFLIEKIALNGYFPFTSIPIPLSGFTSSEMKYEGMVSYQRFFDVLQHIALPLVAILYGELAAQSRLSRTAVLEVMRQDYVRTAKAKGVPTFTIIYKHIGRNAAITIVTSIAGSLGVIIGGSLVVETLFEIDGFGKFFYDSVINRDYNVIMFSAFAGSFLTLLGYLVADIAYTLLDPRVTLD